MTWFFLALACAFFSATSTCLSKLAMRENDEIVVGTMRLLCAAPAFAALVFITPFPRPAPDFIPTVLLLIPLDTAAFLLYLRAIRISPLSVTEPFMTLSPVLTLVSSRLILGEVPNGAGVGGIVLIVIGAYLLNIDTLATGIFSPVRAIFRERGSRYMVAAAALFSVNSVIGKKAIMASSPLFFTAVYFPLLTLVFVGILAARCRRGLSRPRYTPRAVGLFCLLGVVFVLVMLTHTFAISLSQASYMIAIKRTSVLFSVLYGGFVFKERNIRSRFLAAGVMLAGVVCIACAH